ncbi:MAG TPA: hypothetical protein VGE55_13120 [Limnobacter sp.]|uniref:hypothetical protein n=1 Tax=Limnobacter sp. TaxID=2003368 RepID=UPI002ED7881E
MGNSEAHDNSTFELAQALDQAKTECVIDGWAVVRCELDKLSIEHKNHVAFVAFAFDMDSQRLSRVRGRLLELECSRLDTLETPRSKARAMLTDEPDPPAVVVTYPIHHLPRDATMLRLDIADNLRQFGLLEKSP